MNVQRQLCMNIHIRYSSDTLYLLNIWEDTSSYQAYNLIRQTLICLHKTHLNRVWELFFLCGCWIKCYFSLLHLLENTKIMTVICKILMSNHSDHHFFANSARIFGSDTQSSREWAFTRQNNITWPNIYQHF